MDNPRTGPQILGNILLIHEIQGNRLPWTNGASSDVLKYGTNPVLNPSAPSWYQETPAAVSQEGQPGVKRLPSQTGFETEAFKPNTG